MEASNTNNNDDQQSRLINDSRQSAKDSDSRSWPRYKPAGNLWSSLHTNNNEKSAKKLDINKRPYDWKMQSFTLCYHILTRGLFDGIGSDIEISVPVWNKKYQLHRLVLDQSPYFNLLLQSSFQESKSNKITLHFDKNCFITMEAFQFVLEFLYGNKFIAFDDQHREDDRDHMMVVNKANVKEILATSSYLQVDDCSMLCVDYIVKKLNNENVVDYLLFVNKWMVQESTRILDAIFTFLCREAYHMDPDLLVCLPLEWLRKIVESDAFWVPNEYERYIFVKKIIQARYQSYEESSAFVLTDLDTNPSSCAIITQSIYYVHMNFEQLEVIQNDIHPLTKQPLVPEHIIKHALWTQIELRSKIESATEKDTFLNFTVPVSLLNSSLKKFYYPIPTDDTTTYTGECAILLATFSTVAVNDNAQRNDRIKADQYSVYPPFRFSVEFGNIGSIKHGIRVYSDTVFYAGSNWNVYIQKTRSQRKGLLQLGVYLHRHSISHNNISQQRCCSQETTLVFPTSSYSSSSSSTSAEDVNLGEDNSNEQHSAMPPSSPHHSSKHTNNNDSSSFTTWSVSRYSDKRKITKTWFKIYCPSTGPKHALTLFQSSPDNFQVLQSWGWRSTTLCVDEDVDRIQIGSIVTINSGTEDNDLTIASPTSNTSPVATSLSHTIEQNSHSSSNNINIVPTLRFTIIMGHV
ncbi:MAG: hypothetical protein EXX96DRAFT_561363 [Benjaminiella poitrasii]|nr:MAG: hypothetical protein EXX96DRAFT_561363 [Benjaminiella poitrasii]